MMARVAGVVSIVAAGFSAAQSARPPVAPVTFHHVHLRVEDPATAMERYARANGCVKLILQGLGVGVRCGDGYLLFDRNERPPDQPSFHGRVVVTGAGDTAAISVSLEVPDAVAGRTWLRERFGRAAEAVTLAATTRSPAIDEISHIAFGAADPAPVVAGLVAAGARVISRGPESVLLSAPGGLNVEIVHDVGRGPDAFWCAMHPDVRSPIEGKCPICGMTLVPIPPPIFGDYKMRVDYRALDKTRARLTITITDPATSKTVNSFVTVHERPFHLFIVSRDLEFFDHVHPTAAKNGTMTVDVTLPKPDLYMVYGDFYPAGGTPQLLQQAVVTPGADPALRGHLPNPNALQHATAGGQITGNVRVTVTGTNKLPDGSDTVEFDLQELASGAPIRDLEKYLGAPGHVFIVSPDLADADHSHPIDSDSKGPRLSFALRPSRPGLHKVWLQFQRGGKLFTVPFVVDVP